MNGSAASTLTRVSLLMLAVAGMAACRGRSAGERDLATGADTIFVFQGGPSANFPRVSRPRGTGVLRADPAAPPCTTSSALDANRWPVDTVLTSLPGVRAIRVRLPREYERVRLGTWWVRGDNQMPRASFSILIGTDSGYPITGVSPPPRQVYLHECQLALSGRRANVTLFTLQRADGVRTQHVSAYWHQEGNLWVQVMGAQPDTANGADFLTILRTVEVLR